MKKAIVLTSAILLTALAALLLVSCGPEKSAPDFSTADVLTKIAENVSLPEETITLGAGDLLDYYGVAAEKIAEVTAVQDACGYKDEIVIVKAVDEAAAGEIAALLSGHIEYQKESMRSYDAAQYDILCSSRVITNGNYTAMFISAAQRTMEEIFQSFF